MGTCYSTKVEDMSDAHVMKKALPEISKLMSGNGTHQEVEDFAKLVGMDDYNKEAMKVFATKGPEAGFKNLFTNPHTGKQWTYAESRGMYG